MKVQRVLSQDREPYTAGLCQALQRVTCILRRVSNATALAPAELQGSLNCRPLGQGTAQCTTRCCWTSRRRASCMRHGAITPHTYGPRPTATSRRSCQPRYTFWHTPTCSPSLHPPWLRSGDRVLPGVPRTAHPCRPDKPFLYILQESQPLLRSRDQSIYWHAPACSPLLPRP